MKYGLVKEHKQINLEYSIRDASKKAWLYENRNLQIGIIYLF